MKLRAAPALFALLLLGSGGAWGAEEEATPTPAPSPSATPSPAADPFLDGSDAPAFFESEDVAEVTRSTERVEDAPGLIAVITEREIRERGYRTLADLLADVPGFYIEPDERRSVVLTRGVPQSILVVYDGIPLVFDTGRDDLPVGDELSLTHVRRVEVLRGPGTALWGANAFNGIVNVVSEDGRDVGGVHLDLEGGTSGEGDTLRRSASIAAGARRESLEWSLSAHGLAEDGSDRRFLNTPRQYVLMNPVSIPVGTFVDGTGDPSRSLYGEALGKVRWKKLSLLTRWSDFEHRAALSGYSHSLLEEDRNEVRRVPTLAARAAWNETAARGSWSAGLFYLESRHDDRFPLFAMAPAHRFGGEIDVRARSQNAGLDARGEIVAGRQTLSGGVLAAAGETLLATDYVDPQTGTRTENAFRRRFRNTVLQAYAQDRIVFADRWRLTLGASVDDSSDFEPSINPRAGLVVRMGGGWIAKALYGEAIRTPDAYDLIGISGGAAAGSIAAVRGNPALKPEKVRTAELATEYRRGSIATGSLAVFGSRTDDLIEDAAAGGEVTPENRGSRFSIGVEALGTWAPTRKLSLHGSYALVRVADDASEIYGHTLPTAPRHTGTLGVVWSPIPAASLYLGNRAASTRPLRGDGDADRLRPYLVTDLNARYAPPAWPLGLSLSVRNAFDSTYWHRNEAIPGRNVAVEIPGDRRSILFGIEGRF